MPSSVEKVLVRTNGLPEFPFTGTLRYEGLELNVSVCGQITNWLASGQVTSKPAEFESLPARFHIEDDVHAKYRRDSSDKILNQEEPVTSIAELNSFVATLSKQEQEVEYIVFKHNNCKHLIQTYYQMVYTISPDENNQEYECVGTHKYKTLPEEPAPSITGVFEDPSAQDIKFTPVSFFGLYKHNTNLELTPRSSTATYDRHTLLTSNPEHQFNGTQNTVQYAPCVLSVHKPSKTFQFIVMADDRKYTFNIELTNMGTLPEWVSERADPSHLLTATDTDETLLAEIDTDPTVKYGKWVSKNEDAELLEIK